MTTDLEEAQLNARWGVGYGRRRPCSRVLVVEQRGSDRCELLCRLGRELGRVVRDLLGILGRRRFGRRRRECPGVVRRAYRLQRHGTRVS